MLLYDFVVVVYCTLVVQVFNVPVEERRFGGDGGSFGSVNRQAEIIREVMDRTGCTVEISQSKDHSLAIMVSGKLSGVLEARKQILSKLQTQVIGLILVCL